MKGFCLLLLLLLSYSYFAFFRCIDEMKDKIDNFVEEGRRFYFYRRHWTPNRKGVVAT